MTTGSTTKRPDRTARAGAASLPPVSQGSPFPPPGWYADPVAGSMGLRWWDGTGWTRDVAAAGAPGPSPSSPAAPPTPDGGERPVIPARALWWALLGLAAGEIAGSALAGVVAAATGNSTSAVVTLMGEFGLWGGMLASCVVVSRRYGTSSLRRDFTLGIRVRDIWVGVAVAAIGTALSAISSGLFSGSRFEGSNTQILTGQRHNGVGFVIVTLIVALGAPIFEELFFRGLIRTALTSRLGPARAVVAQGLLFGLAHYEPSNGLGNVSVIVTIAALGIILGYAALRTRRLGAGMVGHGLFNLIATLIVLAT
jgi:uncharacterized protein